MSVLKPKSIKWFVENYKEQFFEVLDKAYSPLYGVVPFSDKMKDALISQFGLILKKDYLIGIVDKDKKLIAFGLVFPSLSESVNKSSGKLLPFGLFRMLKQINKPKSIDTGLIAIIPEYQNKGVNSMILSVLMHGMIERGLEYAETNLMLEDNGRIQKQWEVFDYIQHKKRRSYIKEII